MKGAWPPAVPLFVYGLAFAWKALAGGLLVFDDHPGQLYRISHVLTVGLEPWRLNPGWWAGYAELQFYPPGFSYAGAALHYASLGALDLSATYQLLLWIAFLLPGVSTYLLLARALGSPWLALPGAFLALTLSAGSRSGVEEGMRWGLVAARLGWGVLPLLALSLRGWIEGKRPPAAAPALLAAIVLIHPAHAPAGVALVVLAAWHGPGSRRARLGQAALLTAAAMGLAAFWLLPLLAHLDMALPLAWGEPSLATLARPLAERPLLTILTAASALASYMRRCSSASSHASLWLSDLPPALALVILLDAAVAQPLGLRWLPADRLLDSFLLALILGASLALDRVHRRLPTLPSDRAVGGASPDAGGQDPLCAVGRPAGTPARLAATPLAYHRAHATAHGAGDRERHVHSSLADRGAPLHGLARQPTHHASRRAARRDHALRSAARRARRRELQRAGRAAPGVLGRRPRRGRGTIELRRRQSGLHRTLADRPVPRLRLAASPAASCPSAATPSDSSRSMFRLATPPWSSSPTFLARPNGAASD